MNNVKSLGDNKLGGYGIIFNHTDLTGDTFTKNTELGFDRNPIGMPVYYAHNVESIKGKIGTVTHYDIDDVGVWFELELDKSNKYLDAIQKLASNKRLGLSTGSLPHTLDKDDNGNIKTWITGELSLTVTPAEHKTIGISSIKSLEESEKETMSDERMDALEESMKSYSDKIDTILEMWSNTKDVKSGKVAGNSNENASTSFGGWIKAIKQGDSEKIAEVYNEHPANHMKVLNTGDGTEGGYLIPQQFVNTIMTMLERKEIVRPRAVVQPIPYGNIEVPTLDYSQVWAEGQDPNVGGMAMYWTAEGAQDTQTEPEFRQITLASHEATTSVPVTNKLLENNATGLETVLMRLFAEMVAYTEDYAYMRGDGVGKPLGVLNAPATMTTDVDATGITVANVSDMYVKLMEECIDTAVWLVHPLLYADIMSLNADTDAALTFLPDINGRIQPMLFGIPILRSKIMPGNYASGGLMLVDFQKYMIGDDLNMEVALSEHAEFRKRRTLYRCTIRTDGQPMLHTSVPIGPLNNERVSFAVKSSVAS
jgi:HK97 family phage major capsid protein